MVPVSDIINALKLVPEWAKLTHLPGRIAELEKRVAALEAAQSSRPARDACPRCGKPLEIVSTEPHHLFGDMGVRVRKLRCPQCGFETEKELKPGEL